MRQLRAVGAWASLFGLAGCQPQLTAESAKAALSGHYRLVIQPNQVTRGGSSERSKSLRSEELLLREDGTYEQTCNLGGEESQRIRSGRWRYSDGIVVFSKLSDCSGFLGQWGRDTAASLILTGPPNRILLNPDLSVYYEQLTGAETSAR